MNRIFLTVLLISSIAFQAYCQIPDSIAAKLKYDTIPPAGTFQRSSVNRDSNLFVVDTLVAEQPDFTHSSSKAIMLAMVLPGLGQAYNKKYFKMPIVWAAVGTMGYFIVYNTNMYQEASLNYSLDPNDTTERFLRGYRRNLEVSYIGMIAVYALQAVDAYVDAQLYNWDVSENLSLRVAPSLQPLMVPASLTGQSYGLTCSFNIKGR